MALRQTKENQNCYGAFLIVKYNVRDASNGNLCFCKMMPTQLHYAGCLQPHQHSFKFLGMSLQLQCNLMFWAMVHLVDGRLVTLRQEILGSSLSAMMSLIHIAATFQLSVLTKIVPSIEA